MDPDQAGAVLAEALKDTASERLMADESAATFMARMDLLRRSMPEHPWPAFDPVAVVTEMCRGKRSVEELDRVSPVPFLRGSCIIRWIECSKNTPPNHWKSRLGTTSSSSTRWASRRCWRCDCRNSSAGPTPRALPAEESPVIVHLLGPNYRPVQITNDLRSFWTTTYFQVRKDLRVRYPKHSWPEDPLTAKPEAKGRRHR